MKEADTRTSIRPRGAGDYDPRHDAMHHMTRSKIVGDGSNQTKSAAQTIPYLNGKERGRPNFDARQLAAMVGEVKAQGWPVSIHSNGDDTLDLALDAIESVYGAFPVTGVNRIEHCTITRPEQIERMARPASSRAFS